MLASDDDRLTTVGFDGYTCGGCRERFPSLYWFRESAGGMIRCLECAPAEWPSAVPSAETSSPDEHGPSADLEIGMSALLTFVLTVFKDEIAKARRAPGFGTDELLYWSLVLFTWIPILWRGAEEVVQRCGRQVDRMRRAAARRRQRYGERTAEELTDLRAVALGRNRSRS